MFQIQKAQRREAKLKIGITGASGSGKTMSALMLAYGLIGDWGKICVLDTENQSASLYDHLGPYNTGVIEAPYEPKKIQEAITACINSGQEVIIIDSISHFWSGPGGILDIHQRFGGRFQDWAKTTPIYKGMIDGLLLAPVHIITTLRAKADFSIEPGEGGSKSKVIKVGTKPEQREGFDYELSIEFRLNHEHLATASKDRTGLFTGNIPFTITEETGERLRKWNEGGASPRVSKADIASLSQMATSKKLAPADITGLMKKKFNVDRSTNLTIPQYKELFAEILGLQGH
jgi:hypothetical protein